MPNETILYTIADCTVTAGGSTLPVLRFKLITKHNGIPSLFVTVDPLHSTRGTSVGGKAAKATLKLFTKRYVKLQAAADGVSPNANFECIVLSNNGGDNQVLSVTGWVLAGVGLTTSASGNVAVEMELRHPATIMSSTTVNFFGGSFEDKLSPSKLAVAENVLDGIVKGMGYYHRFMQNGAADVLKNEPFFEDALADYEESSKNLEKYLKWSGGPGWPTKGFAKFEKEVAYSIWGYVHGYSGGGATIWRWLSSDILDHYFLSITPTFWDKQLEIGPSVRWDDPLVVIPDTSVMNIALPPKDPMELNGVFSVMDDPTIAINSNQKTRDGLSSTFSAVTMYSESDLPGSRIQVAIPGWTKQLLRAAAGSSTLAGPINYKNKNITSLGNSDVGDGDMGAIVSTKLDDLKTGLEGLCRQQFSEMYRMNMQVSIRCSLMIQSLGSSLYQGNVTAGVNMSIGEKSGLVSFFATDVSHFVDCQSGKAHTDIVGNCVSPGTSAGKSEALKPGNHIY